MKHYMQHYMKKVALILTTWVLLSTAAIADDDVIATLEHFLYGASINSAEIHDQFWAEELTYTSSTGTRFGKAQLMQGVRSSEEVSEENVQAWYRAENIEVKSIGHIRIVNFTLTADSDAEEQQYFLNTGVLVFRDDRWQAINWNATAASAEPSQD